MIICFCYIPNPVNVFIVEELRSCESNKVKLDGYAVVGKCPYSTLRRWVGAKSPVSGGDALSAHLRKK